MNDLFIKLLFGHVVGDFFIQPKAMQVKKGASNKIAATHCLLYTIAIALFTRKFSWKWLLFVFVSHFIVDRWSLADKWLQLIKGRDMPDFYRNGHKNIILPKEDVGSYEESYKKTNYRILRGSFSAIVYTVVDNFTHLISMYYAYPYFSRKKNE